MSSDVTWWRHHSTSAAMQDDHISRSPCQRHVIGWRQRLYCPIHDSTRKPGTDPDQYPLTLTLIQLTLTFWVDLWPKVKISKRAYLAQFFTWISILDSVSSFEAPKLVNWHILHCGFFKGILQGIFKESFYAYPTLSLHRAFALSLREGVRDIYIRHISPM